MLIWSKTIKNRKHVTNGKPSTRYSWPSHDYNMASLHSGYTDVISVHVDVASEPKSHWLGWAERLTSRRNWQMFFLWSPCSWITSPYSGCSITVPLQANFFQRTAHRSTHGQPPNAWKSFLRFTLHIVEPQQFVSTCPKNHQVIFLFFCAGRAQT